jgi:hypothetical protein
MKCLITIKSNKKTNWDNWKDKPLFINFWYKLMNTSNILNN